MGYLLAMPGALAIGLSLGLLGSGGSILTVPVLVYLIGQPEKLAIAGSLAIVGTIALAASAPYVRDRLVSWRMVVLFGLPGMLGTYGGAWSSQFVSGALQFSVFALVMMLMAYQMLKPLELKAINANAHSETKIGLDGLAVGWLTGFVGVGGGFLIVPALVFLGGLSMHRAIATSLIIITLKSFVGFVKYTDVLAAENLTLDYRIIAVISAIGIIGSIGGSQLAAKIREEHLQKSFGVFLICIGAFVLGRSLPTLIN